MKKLIVNIILGVHMGTYLYASIASVSTNPESTLYRNGSAQMEVAQHPLSIRAVDILLQEQQTFRQLNEDNFSDIWKIRYIADTYLAEAGYKNRLCYSKFEAERSPTWQVAAYSSLPGYIDNWITRKMYSIFQQTKVLFRTFFPTDKQPETALKNERAFWSLLEKEIEYTNGQNNGRGALTKEEVIHKQIVFPPTLSCEDSEILLLYNYAPLRTGGEQMHFLLIPNPAKPAENFLELDKQQYINVLSLARKVTLWAEEVFEGQAIVHFFDKTGEIAGQTQPLFHAHLIIVKKGKEETWGRIAMFLRMFMPPSPLPSDELEKRVSHYRDTLGKFLAQ